jgi:D-alanyl-D-alanine carboxypeptidase
MHRRPWVLVGFVLGCGVGADPAPVDGKDTTAASSATTVGAGGHGGDNAGGGVGDGGGASSGLGAALDAALQAALDEQQLLVGDRGLSAAVIVRGKGSWQGASGWSHPGTTVDPEMRFAIYSITKTYTGTMVLALHEAGVLGLHDTVADWVSPPIPNLDPTIELTELLDHTSGIDDLYDNAGFKAAVAADPSRTWTAAEALAYLGPPMAPPGQGYAYTTTNYLVVGMMIEAATTVPYHEELGSLVLDPLSLDATFLEPQLPASPPVVHMWKGGMDLFGTPRQSAFSTVWSGGAILATAENVARFYQELFGGTLIDAASLDHMLSAGFGIFEYQVAGRSAWGHIGGGVGGKSCAFYEPESATSVAVLLNEHTGGVDVLDFCRALFEVVLAAPP